MKKYKASFVMEVEDTCELGENFGPTDMLEQDDQDGLELGFRVKNIKVEEIK